MHNASNPHRKGQNKDTKPSYFLQIFQFMSFSSQGLTNISEYSISVEELQQLLAKEGRCNG